MEQDENPELALKVIERRKKSSAAFQSELVMLERFQVVEHDYIIRLLASYQKGEDCHFLFPLANGNLMWLMRQNPNFRSENGFAPWIIAQMKGICDALCKVHKQESPTTAHLDPSYTDGTTSSHGIYLYFRQMSPIRSPTPKLGILQLADFGIGKFCGVQSGSGTATWRGTPTYAARRVLCVPNPVLQTPRFQDLS
jgi:serine/threonine protein kinase